MTEQERLWSAAVTAMQAWIIRGANYSNNNRRFADETVEFAFDCAERMLAEFKKRTGQE